MAAPIDRLTELCTELERWVKEDLERGDPGTDGVQRLTELFRQALYREMADERIFKLILKILSRGSQEVRAHVGTYDPSLECWLDMLAECFRCLRNACVQCTQNQDTIRNVGLIEESISLLQVFSSSDTSQESCLMAFRCGLQFLGNVAGGNQDSQNSIWKQAFPHLFLNCLTHDDDKVAAYSAMVLFTCMGDDKMAEVMDPANLRVALSTITAYSKRPNAEWLCPVAAATTLMGVRHMTCDVSGPGLRARGGGGGSVLVFTVHMDKRHLIVTDRFLRCPELVKQMFAEQSHSDRVVLLELILAKVSEKSPLSEEEVVSLQRIAEFLGDRFQDQCRSVLKLADPGDCDQQEALVVIRLLDVLCEMTSDNEHLTCLQSCPRLLDTVVDTLRLTHLAGKQSKNVFTSVHTLSLGEDLTHAAVGFKAHLIRLIANLCYRNKENQDKIYQLDGIPLILDNCSIDDNNPFLNQWAVYAIRNLTEQNEKNQELIASMERQGLADTSQLESMGLRVEERDSKLILKSVKKT